MGVVVASHSMSLDGFIVRADRTPGPLHDWLWSGDQPSRHGEDSSSRHPVATGSTRAFDRVGATVAGRRTYEDSGRWGGQLPFDWPFFIVTHEPPEDADEVPFEFVTEGVEPAIEAAKSAAGDKDVSLMGGEIVRQALAARPWTRWRSTSCRSCSATAFACSTSPLRRSSSSRRRWSRRPA